MADFVAQQPRLFKIAYGILGSAVEAEDVVQDAWLRWQRTDRTLVHNPAAFLATTTSRLAINVLQAARTRHEASVTPWLEDLSDTTASPAASPELTAERSEAVGLALHALVERLSPAERAAYLLRIAFDYPYRQIAKVLQLSVPNARQLVVRARGRMLSPRSQPVDSETHRRLVRAFVSAAQAGDFADLEALLAADILGPPHGASPASDVTSAAAVRSFT